MKKINRLCAVLLASGLLYSAPSFSVVTVLDFEGAGNLANLLNFYNGGTDSVGNFGTNYGVSFSGDTQSLIDSDAGGSGNFANEPSPSTIMFFLQANSGVLNMATGFDTGFSFFYSSSTAAVVSVYDSLGATGNLLGSINLAAQHTSNCVGDPFGAFCNWTAAGVSFAGIGKSIDFGGTANYTGYDNITFGTATPVVGVIPEPEIYAMMAAGLGMMGYVARRRKQQLAAA